MQTTQSRRYAKQRQHQNRQYRRLQRAAQKALRVVQNERMFQTFLALVQEQYTQSAH